MIGEPSFCALTSTPSMAPSSEDETEPDNVWDIPGAHRQKRKAALSAQRQSRTHERTPSRSTLPVTASEDNTRFRPDLSHRPPDGARHSPACNLPWSKRS